MSTETTNPVFIRKITVRLSCLLALSALISGCALSVDKIPLTYNPRAARDKIPGADGVKVQVTVVDNRPDKNLVGKKINGFGSEHGGIASTSDVPGLIRDALESELNLRGFPKGDSVQVTCDLNQFWNHFNQGFWAGDSHASINLVISIRGPDGTVIFFKNIQTDGLEPNIQLANGTNARASLEQALYRAIESLFDDPAFVPSLFKAAGVTQP